MFRCYFSNLVALIVVLIWVNTLIIWNLMILLNRRLSKHILILIYIATTIHLFYLIILQVLSHYPPSHLENLENQKNKPAARLCGPIFATSDLEAQIIRLEGLGVRLCLLVYCEEDHAVFVFLIVFFPRVE